MNPGGNDANKRLGLQIEKPSSSEDKYEKYKWANLKHYTLVDVSVKVISQGSDVI